LSPQAVLPGYVVSKLSGLRKASFFAPTPEEFVKSALSRLGIHSRTMGYWTHDLRVVITDLLPVALVENVSYNQMAVIRNMALKKIAKAKLAHKEKMAQFG
jgi:17beta-estradiol 17-dehydrogenase / very-long-chain 3-oxoacyl-CoA reductase